MAERRMFAKSVVESDAFLDMPQSAQTLYFHLSMEADDDGFVNNPKTIQRMIGASDKDMKALDAKQYIISFDSGVIAIRHWKLNNYIQKDRYKETTCIEEKAQISEKNGMYTKCIQNVYKMYTQVRLGKDRLGKDSIGESMDEPQGSSSQQQQQPVEPLGSSQQSKSSKKFIKPTLKELEEYAKSIEYNSFDSEKFMDYYDSKGWIVGKTKMKDWKATVRNWKRSEGTYKKQGVKDAGRITSIQVPEYLKQQNENSLPKGGKASKELIAEIEEMRKKRK